MCLSSTVVSFGTDVSGLIRLIMVVQEPLKIARKLLFKDNIDVHSRMAKLIIKMESILIVLLFAKQFCKCGLGYDTLQVNNFKQCPLSRTQKYCGSHFEETNGNFDHNMNSYLITAS